MSDTVKPTPRRFGRQAMTQMLRELASNKRVPPKVRFQCIELNARINGFIDRPASDAEEKATKLQNSLLG